MNDELRVDQYLAGADPDTIFSAASTWSTTSTSLTTLAQQMRTQAATLETTFGGQTGTHARAAFEQAAQLLSTHADRFNQGSTAYTTAANALQHARTVRHGAGFPATAPAPGTPPQPTTTTPDTAEIQQQIAWNAKNSAYQQSISDRTAKSNHLADHIDKEFAAATATMKTLAGADDPATSGSGGGGGAGSGAPSGGGTPTRFVPTGIEPVPTTTKKKPPTSPTSPTAPTSPTSPTAPTAPTSGSAGTHGPTGPTGPGTASTPSGAQPVAAQLPSGTSTDPGQPGAWQPPTTGAGSDGGGIGPGAVLKDVGAAGGALGAGLLGLRGLAGRGGVPGLSNVPGLRGGGVPTEPELAPGAGRASGSALASGSAAEAEAEAEGAGMVGRGVGSTGGAAGGRTTPLGAGAGGRGTDKKRTRGSRDLWDDGSDWIDDEASGTDVVR